MYDLHVRKVKKCRIQPVGTRRPRASNSRSDNTGRSHRNKTYQSQHASPRGEAQQNRGRSSENYGESSRGGKDRIMAREQWGKRDTIVGLPIDNTQFPDGRKSQLCNLRTDNSAHLGDASLNTYSGGFDSFSSVDDVGNRSALCQLAVGRGMHVAQPLSPGTPGGGRRPSLGTSRDGTRHSPGKPGFGKIPSPSTPVCGERSSPSTHDGSKRPSPAALRDGNRPSLETPEDSTRHSSTGFRLQSPDGQNTSRGSAPTDGQQRSYTSPISKESGQFVDAVPSTHNNPSTTSSKSQRNHPHLRADRSEIMAALEGCSSQAEQQGWRTEAAVSKSDLFSPPPLTSAAGRNIVTADDCNALNQTDSDVIIEESGSEEDESWT